MGWKVNIKRILWKRLNILGYTKFRNKNTRIYTVTFLDVLDFLTIVAVANRGSAVTTMGLLFWGAIVGGFGRELVTGRHTQVNIFTLHRIACTPCTSGKLLENELSVLTDPFLKTLSVCQSHADEYNFGLSWNNLRVICFSSCAH